MATFAEAGLQLSVFALGIMPYITASIIIQLLRVVIPRFEELHKEGQSGTAKLTEYTRYLTIGLGVLQSSAIVATASTAQPFGMRRPDPLVPNSSPPRTVRVPFEATGFQLDVEDVVTAKLSSSDVAFHIRFHPTIWP